MNWIFLCLLLPFNVNIVFSAAVVADIGYKYLGCYRDQEPRLLQGFMRDFGEDLVPLDCVQLCKEYGYMYAGLQYRQQCFCGDQPPPDSKKVPEHECSSKCSGDFTAICGGTWRETVYATGLTGVAKIAEINYTYEGCYRDSERRRLNSYIKDFGSYLIPEECVSLCKRYGYRFAGLQYRSQCFCGDNDLAPADRRPDSECSYKCSGDFTQLCGGHYRNTVYNTGINDTASIGNPGYPYMGCYRDSQHRRKIKGDFQDFGENNSPEVCVEFCSNRGYKYAGLQYSSQCFCGDQTPLDKDKVEDRECASRCSGDRTYYCGAGWRNTVYDLQMASPTVAKFGDQYVGCFQDFIESRKLNGKYLNMESEATPKNCIDYCLKEGFLFAGLQERQHCFCGNAEPSTNDAKNESECNSRCIGDNTKICGGKLKNTIYKTNLPISTKNESPETTCEMSLTTVNGKPTCKGQIVFFDDFTNNQLSEKWNHEIKFGGEPDSEFVVYDADATNSYIKDGKLVINPVLMPNDFVLRGNVKLDKCTGKPGSAECEQEAIAYLVLPPVKSARINTHKNFNFRYGRVDIRAKLPTGDWLVPDIRLDSSESSYGPNYSSGRICLAMSRGNEYLISKNEDLGCKTLEVGVVMGVDDYIRELTSNISNSECWNTRFHEYSLVWTHNNISFLVDGEHRASMLTANQGKLSEAVGFSNDISALWSEGSDIAPFDTDFYITLGLSAGGVRSFPDSVVNAGRVKPWTNTDPKRILNFWKSKSYWKSSWTASSVLEIDYVRVTAI